MNDLSTVVENYFHSINEGNVERWVQLFTEEGVSHDPVGVAAYKGHEQLRKFFTGISKAFQKVTFRSEEVHICANNAASKWQAVGVGHSGIEVPFCGIDTFEFDEHGKIVEVKAYWDFKSTMAKLKG